MSVLSASTGTSTFLAFLVERHGPPCKARHRAKSFGRAAPVSLQKATGELRALVLAAGAFDGRPKTAAQAAARR